MCNTHIFDEESTMKALVVQEFGKSPIYMDFPDPIVGPDEVRVAVKAAAMSQVE